MKLANTKRKAPPLQLKQVQPKVPPIKYPKLRIEPIGDHLFTINSTEDQHWKNFGLLGGKYNTQAGRWLFDGDFREAVEHYIKTGKVKTPQISSETVSRRDIYKKIEGAFEKDKIYTSEDILKVLEELG